MSIVKHLLITLLYCAMVLSCGITDTGDSSSSEDSGSNSKSLDNPQTINIDVIGAVNATETENGKIAAKTFTTNGDSFTNVLLNIDLIKFRRNESCTDDPDVEEENATFKGPFVVDLTNEVTTPDPDETQIEQEEYCGIDVQLKKLNQNKIPIGVDANSEIVQHSIFAAGTTDQGVMFQLILDSTINIRIRDDNGFTLEDESNSLLITLDLAIWLDGIDIDSGTVSQDEDGNDIIVIDKQNNKSLHQAIRKQIHLSTLLFKDKDGNGQLGADEKGSGDVLGQGLPE